MQRELESVLAATCELLAEGGLPAATVDAISARSGVSSAAIRGHWPNHVAIAAEAFGRQVDDHVPLPDTGSAPCDLAEAVVRVSEYYASPAGSVLSQILAACLTDPASAPHFREFYLAGRRKAVARLWQRAIERGEVDSEIDVSTAADLLFGPLVFRLISGHAPLSKTEADALTLAALHGLLAK